MLSQTMAQRVASALRGLQYGSVHLVIHEGQVVRIERIERISLPAAPKTHRFGVAAQAGLTTSSEAPSTTLSQPTDAHGGLLRVDEE